MKKIYFIIAATCLSYQLKAQIYVTQNGLGNKDGSSWNHAYEGAKLQQAINEAEVASVKEVWVAKGTYTPTEKIDATGTDRDKSFILRNGVKIYGGFAGGESSINDRTAISTTNETILSGDLGGNDDPLTATTKNENAYHVVANVANVSGVVLDGFTITGGYANGANNSLAGLHRRYGGGICIGPNNAGITFSSLIIKNNYATYNGGGACLYGSSDNEHVFENVQFIANKTGSDGRGGAVYVPDGNTKMRFKNSLFAANESPAGAALHFRNATSEATLEKCKIYNNIATGIGGAFNLYGGKINLYNSIIYGNEANTAAIGYVGSSGQSGAFIAINNTFYKNQDNSAEGVLTFWSTAAGANLKLYNNVFIGNISNGVSSDVRRNATAAIQDYQYNLFETNFNNGVELNRNTANNMVYNSALPLFASITETDLNFLHLVEGQATQKGSNTLATNAGLLPGTDLADNNREQHAIIDLGAYEYQGVLPVTFDYFKAKKEGATANLSWRTLAENNSSHFMVQRGSSPSNFVDIKRIEANGNTNEPKAYGYIDQNPLAGVNYYRLVQYDYNGDHKVLGEQALTFTLNGSQNLVYPNPAGKYVSVKLSDASGIATIDLVNLTGQNVISKTYSISASGEITIDLSGVPAGTYVLWINKGKANNDKKLLVVK